MKQRNKRTTTCISAMLISLFRSMAVDASISAAGAMLGDARHEAQLKREQNIKCDVCLIVFVGDGFPTFA